MFIYHLEDDEYTNIFGNKSTIKDSKGLTINGNLITMYTINATHEITLSVVAPFLVREIRPDGLTRSFSAGLSYGYTF